MYYVLCMVLEGGYGGSIVEAHSTYLSIADVDAGELERCQFL